MSTTIASGRGRTAFLATFAASAALLVAACVTPQVADRATEAEAQAMVADAIALYDAEGDAAIAEFNRGPEGAFRQGELYVAVLTRGADATILAHAGDAEMVGVPLASITNAEGEAFILEMAETATPEGSWHSYEWTNPVSGVVEPKSSWAVLHEDLVFMAGVYSD